GSLFRSDPGTIQPITSDLLTVAPRVSYIRVVTFPKCSRPLNARLDVGEEDCPFDAGFPSSCVEGSLAGTKGDGSRWPWPEIAPRRGGFATRSEVAWLSQKPHRMIRTTTRSRRRSRGCRRRRPSQPLLPWEICFSLTAWSRPTIPPRSFP